MSKVFNLFCLLLFAFSLAIGGLLTQDVVAEKALAATKPAHVISETEGYVSRFWSVQAQKHTVYYLQLQGSKTTYKFTAKVNKPLEQGIPVMVDYVAGSGTLLSALAVEVIS